MKHNKEYFFFFAWRWLVLLESELGRIYEYISWDLESYKYYLQILRHVEQSRLYSCVRNLSVRLLPPNRAAFGIVGSKNRKIPIFFSIFGPIFAIFRVSDV
jgi:hypothetical protein